MKKSILFSDEFSSCEISPTELAHLQKAEDEPIYLTAEDMPKVEPVPAPPTLEQIARRAAEIVVEMQALKIAEDQPAPVKPRKVRKTVIRDANNRIAEVLEEDM
jgi:hypothetical protein